MIKFIIKHSFLVLVLMLMSYSINAQPGNPGDPNDNPVPITGIEVLIAAGAALGIRAIVKKKK